MPFLRQEADTSLGDTLGNLGSQLTQAFNPLRQIQAQSALSEIQARQWELHQKQVIDAANRNAADVYDRMPLQPGETQAMHDVTSAQIRAGNADMSKTIDAIKATGGYAANKAASDLVDTDPDMASYTPADRASIKAQVLSGTLSLADAKKQHAETALKTNEAGATIGATTSARTAATSTAPGMGANADLAAEQAARGDVEGARKTIAAGVVASADPNTPFRSPASQNIVTQQAIAGITPPAGQPPLISQQPDQQAADVGKAVAEAALKPGPPGDVLRGGTYDPITNSFTPAPAPGAPVPAPPSGPAVTVPPVGPDTGATQATAGAAATGTEQAKADVANVNTAMDEATSAQNLNSKLDQLAELTKLYESMGSGTLDTNLLKYINDRWGVTYGTRAEIYKAMENLINDELPDARKAAGIQRLAAPEISATKLIIGAANLPPSVLYQIIANEQGMANLQIEKGALAQKVKAGQLSMTDYYKQKTAIEGRIHGTIEALRKQYGATGVAKTTPTPNGSRPPVTIIDRNGNPIQ
jgi:hypothetical protein